MGRILATILVVAGIIGSLIYDSVVPFSLFLVMAACAYLWDRV